MSGHGIERALVTGASGGIGRAVALELATRGVAVGVVGRDPERTAETARAVRAAGGTAHELVTDLAADGAADTLAGRARSVLGDVDAVFHVAGVGGFHPVEADTEASLDRMLAVNVRAPLLLSRALLPHMKRAGRGRLVFVGSIFGALGFPWFAAYSATKHAIRGYCDALRRELDGTGVDVVHVAPRGTRTPMSSGYADMAEAVGMALDEPADVARRIVEAALAGRPHTFLGGQERMGVRLNAVAPRLVDRMLRSQKEAMEPYARAAGRPPVPPPAATPSPTRTRRVPS